MVRTLLALAWLLPFPVLGGTAADIARAIRENSFDRDECYRVRDLTLIKEDIRDLSDRRLPDLQQAGGRAQDGGGLLHRCGRRRWRGDFAAARSRRTPFARRLYRRAESGRAHSSAALLLFTGDVYEQLKSQMANNPANRKAPEMGPVLDEQWSSVLRNLGDQLSGEADARSARRTGARRAACSPACSAAPSSATSTSSTTRTTSSRSWPGSSPRGRTACSSTPGPVFRRDRRARILTPLVRDPQIGDYRIDATVAPDLTLNVVSRVKVKVTAASLAVAPFEIAREMSVTEVRVDGVPAEVLQAETARLNLVRGGNNLFLVVPAEPLRAGREYEFEFRHSGKVIHEAGDHRLLRQFPRQLVSGQRASLFQLRSHLPLPARTGTGERGRYGGRSDRGRHARGAPPHRRARTDRGFQPGRLRTRESGARRVRGGRIRQPQTGSCAAAARSHAAPPPRCRRRGHARAAARTPWKRAPPIEPRMPNPLEHLQTLAGEVASAMEFMASRFGPPALPHLTVSPIPGTFGQGFPGLIYLSTLAYLKAVPGTRIGGGSASAELFFQDVLQAHETAHQWWGNRVTPATYRDNWLMEALANYSALLYLEKRRGTHSMEIMLDNYRDIAAGQERSGPDGGFRRPDRARHAPGNLAGAARVARHHLRQGKLDHADAARPDGRPEVSGAAGRDQQALRPQGNHHRGVPPARRRNTCRRNPTTRSWRASSNSGSTARASRRSSSRWTVKGAAPNVRLTGTVTQSGVDEDFTAAVPVEITIARGRTMTQWVRSAERPGHVHGAAEGGAAEGGAGSALRAAEEVDMGLLAERTMSGAPPLTRGGAREWDRPARRGARAAGWRRSIPA